MTTLDLERAWRRELRAGLGALASGDFDAALTAFESAHRRAPDRAEVAVALGRERLRRGQLAEAEPLLRGAWQADRSLASAAASLARALGTQHARATEAHALLDDALTEHPDDPGLLVIRSEILLAEGRITDARAAAEGAIAAAASAATGRRGRTRSSQAAQKAAGLALARVHNALGLSLAAAGDSEQALFSFKRASDLDPDWAAPVVNMGAAFARLGRAARARSTWERALVIDGDNVPARLNLADLARASSDWDVAERGYRAALALDENQQGIRRALALVRLERGDASEAAALLAWEHARAPGDALLATQLARALAASDRESDAESVLRAALAAAPDSAPLTAALAQLLASLGRYIEAAELASRARVLDPSL